jgi:hypothetical protein
MKNLLLLLFTCILFSCNNKVAKDRLAKASSEYKNGWFYVHLEGSSTDIGYQHGYLLSTQIDTAIQAASYYLAHETKHEWDFYRAAAKNFLWNKLDQEYKNEINGIAEGLQAKGLKYDIRRC